MSIVATAVADKVDVFDSRGGAAPIHTLANPTETGNPLVFLVQRRGPDPGWLQVHLPVRPNGSTGWIRTDDVDLTHHRYRVVVELSAHQVAVYNGDDMIIREPVGIGTATTPTPGGVFYIKELLRAPDPSGSYGPYAYGLSGFSNVLDSFGTGEGVIGLHGTNDPTTLGTDVSHGCIRMSNDAITRLAQILPLGTPVEIRP